MQQPGAERCSMAHPHHPAHRLQTPGLGTLRTPAQGGEDEVYGQGHGLTTCHPEAGLVSTMPTVLGARPGQKDSVRVVAYPPPYPYPYLCQDRRHIQDFSHWLLRRGGVWTQPRRWRVAAAAAVLY